MEGKLEIRSVSAMFAFTVLKERGVMNDFNVD